ncbi:MAG: dTDP-4-dehydrorhamnose reductase [Cycloclasticus sp.]|nr:dTDP-4-dehydrorhamnose reductase [Cycloclasticus sp.]
MPNTQRILIIGSTGQLGQSIHAIEGNYPQYDMVFAKRKQLDLSDAQHITEYFKQNKFDVIINCAAYTAVDKAESEPDLADKINHLAVQQLAQIAVQQQAKLIHVSTDYVFNGQQHRPYIETDAVAPQGVYGSTKLAGEQAVQNTMVNNAFIIRTSWVYSQFGNNFVKTMLKLGGERDALTVIYDQIGTPTYAHDLAEAIMSMVNSQPFNQASFKSQLFHYSNEGVCSWYDFAKAIFEHSNVQCKVSPIETKDYPTPAKRPAYSLLNKAKIKDTFGLSIPYWKDSLKQCLINISKC